jgi:signal transduction histidine kinase
MSRTKIEIAREKILNETLLAFAILGIPIVGSSLVRTIQVGWTFLFTWHVFLVSLLWIMYLLRHLIALNVKVYALVVLALFTGFYGAYELGLQGGWQIIVVAAPILITIFFGRYYGLVSLIIVGILLSIIAYLYITNSITPAQDFLAINSSKYFWTNTIVTLLLLISPLLISIGKVQQLLNENIQDYSHNMEKLTHLQNELSTTFDFIPIPLLVFNHDNEVIRINRRFTKLFGFDLIDLDTISDFFEKAFPDIEERSTALILWNNNTHNAKEYLDQSKSATYKVHTKDGKVVHIEIFFKAFDNKVMAVFNDLSLQMQSKEEIRESDEKLQLQNDEFLKLNQELMQSNDQITEMNQKLMMAKVKAEESDYHKTVFLQNMSHEIRTPLNAIIGFTEMLTDKDLPENQRDSYLDIVLNSGNQLLDVVNDIISVSSIEAGLAVLLEEPTNINDLLNSIIPIYIEKAKESNLKFSAHLSLDNQDAVMVMDGKKVKQIVVNLINNAFKFTSKGKISIGYNLRSNFIVFYVKDTGVGIKQEYHQSIFDRFSKGENDLTRRYSGTGLGLSISKSFVELMGGRIWLLSEAEKGATFFFTVPYKPYESKTKDQPSK